MIRVTANTEQVAQAIQALGRRAPKAIASGINKGSRDVRNAAILTAKEKTPSRVRFIQHAIRIHPRANVHNLRAIVTMAGKNIPLIQLGAKNLKHGGVTWNAKGKLPRHLPHAFIVARAGKRQVFVRSITEKPQLVDRIVIRHKRLHRKGSDTPIAFVVAPGIGSVFAWPSARRKLEEVGDRAVPHHIIKELNEAIRKEGFLDE